MRENDENKLRYCKTLYKNGISGHCDESITLADYYPRISEIVTSDSRLYITDKSISDGTLTINGTADAYVLYRGDNGELVPLSRNIGFTEKLSVKNCSEDDAVMITLIKDSVSSKGNGVHAEIKCGYRMEICIIGNTETDTLCGDGIETLCREQRVIRHCCSDRKNSYIEEDITLGESNPRAKRLLFNNGYVTVGECKTVSGKVITKGTLHISAVYENEDGGISEINSDIPFSRIFDTDDCGEDAKAICRMELCDLKMELYDGTGGENKIIACEANVDCEANVFETSMEMLPYDAYSTEHESEVHTEAADMIVDVNNICVEGGFTVTLELEETTARIDSVIADAVIDSAVSGDEQASVTGNIVVHMLAADADGRNASKVTTTPFNIVFPGTAKCSMVRLSAYVTGTTYTISADGQVTVTGNVCGECACAETEETLFVSLLAQQEESLPKRGCITVYYPESGEDWWRIAKRFHLRADDLRRANGSAPTPGKAVLIPRK